ncbi:GspH/FimT family pseudopilin [Croceicoccus sediminis]|uniref:GspH/FimT family pseudopilin n=1 Tax=Croceicoccus sediminis TaxID=2571150 RepID=UPI001181DFBE|nr:GspH/FimT family pseudopilin [Croceicoccus sediminis]
MPRRRPAPFSRVKPNGFSLVELMVVLFVIALMAGAVVLAMPNGAGDLRREAEKFAARTIAARNEAISTSASVATIVGPAGYYFERRVEGRWAPLDGRSLTATDWDEGTQAVIAGQGDNAPANRRVIFDPLGLASEDLRVTLSHDGNAMVVTVRRNGEVAVSGQ